MIKFLCDRCKKELQESTQNVVTYTRVVQEWKSILETNEPQIKKVPRFYDLCDDCLEKIKSVIENGQEQ
jgi:hypothetical protein